MNSLWTGTSWRKYDQARERQFAERVASEVQRLPGVRMVATTDYAPLEAVLFPYQISDPGNGRRAQLMGRHVTTGYFEVLGVPLLAGRAFEAADGNRQPVPVVINRRAAQELFGETPPVGKLVSNYRSRSTMVILGVAGDTRQLALTEAPGPQIYVPAQSGSNRVLLIPIEGGTADLSASIRQLVRNLDPEVPAREVRSLQGNFERYVARPRFYASLVGAYAVTGLLLGALGVYGLTSYTVAGRMNEFGIRISLGLRLPILPRWFCRTECG